jgi:transcriptional regulator with PAS, ATPase and Fis domain
MFAQLIHTLSKRQGRLVALNCGAIPKDLVESTLFGHERGSFTGAVNKQAGKFQEADKGTLFLDEIGEMPKASQVALLRVLQDQMIQPLGASQPHKVDVRVIAATNRNLLEEVKQGRFREDLYYRLCLIALKIPPLRERRSEIAPIAIFILERLNRSFRRQRRFSPAALRKISSYSWPGNVRQLDGVLRSAVILAENDLIDAEDLDLGATSSNFQLPEPGEGFNMEDFLAEARVNLIHRALEISDGNQAAAGRLLGTSGQNISKFLKSKANAG